MGNTMLRLTLPTDKYKNQYLEGLRDFLSEAEHPEAIKEQIKNFETYVKENKSEHRQVSEYWLIDSDRYIGTIQIRYKPTGRFADLKSNIYYEIRPSERQKGYGEKILRLGLKKAKSIGLKKIDITCSVDNIASQRIIKKNSGVLRQEVKTPDGNYLLFTIKIN